MSWGLLPKTATVPLAVYHRGLLSLPLLDVSPAVSPENSAPRVLPLDLADPSHAASFLDLLDHYAHDPMGGGTGLDALVKETLVTSLRKVPHFYGALAFVDGRAVGLINCFFGFSTFVGAPLLNVHDIVVHADVRGTGIGQALLAHVEQVASQKGCCKLTLEVLSNNQVAMKSYERAGFKPYVLDPAAGQALFLQKKLLP
jgi:GNAT superfamily N-acetyltransferase